MEAGRGLLIHSTNCFNHLQCSRHCSSGQTKDPAVMGQHKHNDNKHNHNDMLNKKTFVASSFSERKGLLSHMLARKRTMSWDIHSLRHQ